MPGSDGTPTLVEDPSSEPTLVEGAGDVTMTTLEPGDVIAGKYRVLKLLGVGGMGAVYLVQHVEIRKKLAIKVMVRELAATPEMAERFLQEARAASLIESPHVVDIVDSGQLDDGSLFLVMEYLEGRSLSDVLEQEGALPWPRLRKIALQVCSALQKAHDKGIVHRDLKPDNIILIDFDGDPDFVKIVDFGIAKVLDERLDDRKHKTRLGVVLGTPHYMAPEQALGHRATAAVDIYAMGVILFEMATGRVPFDSDDYMRVMGMHISEPVPSIFDIRPDARVPRGLDRIIRKAMAKEKDARYASMADLAAAIEALPVEVTEGNVTRPPSRRWTLWLVGGAFLSVAGVAGLLSYDWDSRQGDVEGSPPLKKVEFGSKMAMPMAPDGLQPFSRPKDVAVPAPEPMKPAQPAMLSLRVPNAPNAEILLKQGRMVVVRDGRDEEIVVTDAPIRLGSAPLKLRFRPTGQKVVLLIRAKGYQECEVEVTLSESLDLERMLAKKGRTVRRRSRKPAPKRPRKRNNTKKKLDIKPGELILQ